MLKWRRGTMIVLGTLAVVAVRPMPVNAEDFDAGKSAPQLFASNCSSCHRTPYGLAKRMNNWSLDSFLREHYTASRASADTLSAYLVGLDGSARENRQKPSELAPTNNQRNPSRSTPPSDSGSLVGTLTAFSLAWTAPRVIVGTSGRSQLHRPPVTRLNRYCVHPKTFPTVRCRDASRSASSRRGSRASPLASDEMCRLGGP